MSSTVFVKVINMISHRKAWTSLLRSRVERAGERRVCACLVYVCVCGVGPGPVSVCMCGDVSQE